MGMPKFIGGSGIRSKETAPRGGTITVPNAVRGDAANVLATVGAETVQSRIEPQAPTTVSAEDRRPLSRTITWLDATHYRVDYLGRTGMTHITMYAPDGRIR